MTLAFDDSVLLDSSQCDYTVLSQWVNTVLSQGKPKNANHPWCLFSFCTSDGNFYVTLVFSYLN